MGLDVFPLTPVQEEILFQTLRQPLGAGVYLSHLILRMGDEVDPRVLILAGERVQARHDALRTAFDWSGRGDPVQRVFAGAGLPLIARDWRDVPEEERQGRLRGFLVADRLKGLDLAEPPLVRLALIRFGPTDCRLVLTFHQIVLDHLSAARVLGEILECYRALGRDKQWSPPPAPGFGRFTHWLRHRREAGSESFWREYLQGFTSPTPMPPPLPPEQTGAREKRREPGDTITAAWERRVLDQAFTAALERTAEDLGLSPRALVTGAWALLLSRHSGREEVLFAVVESVRGLAPPELVGVGNHLGMVPLRVGLDQEIRLDHWLAGLTQDYNGLYVSQAASLSRIRALSPIPGEDPLFETYLSFGTRSLESAFGQGEDHGAGPELTFETRTPMPLLLSALAGEELVLDLEYDRRRYSREAASRIIGQVEALLRSMVRTPGARLKELSGLTEPEARRMFLEWQPSLPPEPAETRIHRLFQEAAARNPQALAVRHGEERLTYSRLEQRANRWAHYLQELGVGPDTLVGLALVRSLDQIVLLLAVLKAGGAYLPLDPTYPPDRLSYMIRDSGANLVIASTRTGNLEGLEDVRVVLLDEAGEQVRRMPPGPPPCRAAGENLALMSSTPPDPPAGPRGSWWSTGPWPATSSIPARSSASQPWTAVSSSPPSVSTRPRKRSSWPF